MAVTGADQWHRFVAELSANPFLVAVLLDAHRPAPDGRCLACTTPGRGTPQAHWPCALFLVAEAAQGQSR